jgi:hypothetical protein
LAYVTERKQAGVFTSRIAAGEALVRLRELRLPGESAFLERITQ